MTVLFQIIAKSTTELPICCKNIVSSNIVLLERKEFPHCFILATDFFKNYTCDYV